MTEHGGQPRERQRRRTSERVYFWDRFSTGVITFGGVGVLGAVLGLCVYLVWVAAPLFVGSAVRPGTAGPATPTGSRVLARAFDDDARAMVTLDASRDGAQTAVRASSLTDGTTFAEIPVLADGSAPTCASEPQKDGLIALGFADGSVRIGSVGLTEALVPESGVPSHLRSLAVGGEAALPPGVAGSGRSAGLLLRPTADRFRELRPSAEFGDAVRLRSAGDGEPGNGVIRIDLKVSPAGQRYIAAARRDGTIIFGTVRSVRGLGAKKAKDAIDEVAVPPPPASSPPPPSPSPAGGPGVQPTSGGTAGPWLFVLADGSGMLALDADGTVRRYAVLRDGAAGGQGTHVQPADDLRLFAGTTTRVTAAAMLQGGLTLVAGDSVGRLHAVMVGRDPTAGTPDAMRLVRSASIDLADGRATSVGALAVSGRDRLVAAALADGSVVVRHMTSRKQVARVAGTPDSGAATALAILPKGDGLYARIGAAGAASGTFRVWRLEGGFPEASAAALFLPLLYEGQVAPTFTYQSSGGNEGSESKTSLVPLIFGTIKATIVAMLFAVPLAVLAAIYTSEFLTPTMRRAVKPAVESMASLPSVVLGFIAAMVVAPLIADRLAGVLAAIVLVPVGLLGAAHVWQMLPARTVLVVGRRWRAWLIAGTIGVMLMAAWAAGPIVERALFVPTRADVLVAAGRYEPVQRDRWPSWVGTRTSMSADDERPLRRAGLYFRDGTVVRPTADSSEAAGTSAAPSGLIPWLNGTIGDATPGWFVLLALPMVLVAWFGLDRVLTAAGIADRVGARAADQAARRRARAGFELARFAASLAVGAIAAGVIARAMTAGGLDPRDSLLGPFSQRNALVVGLIMGFAIVPIIYTISEDALRSVPASLRSASLGVGATPWQTAVRVVLPAAGSGVFSACMIGLGRAVGETMIVLMATGNTPEMTPNLFSGFRTLAANIAVELPEAERGGTHYRVLFLCGLTLFAMTFIINTTAEVVRQRFRKRTAAL